MTTNASAFSTKVEFEFRDFERSHGRAPKFGPDAAGWAFIVPEFSATEIIWTRGRKVREIKAEIAAHVKAPVGTLIVARVQP